MSSGPVVGEGEGLLTLHARADLRKTTQGYPDLAQCRTIQISARTLTPARCVAALLAALAGPDAAGGADGAGGAALRAVPTAELAVLVHPARVYLMEDEDIDAEEGWVPFLSCVRRDWWRLGLAVFFFFFFLNMGL
jgi:hypothetical protein